MPRRFMFPIEIGETRTSLRGTRSVLLQEEAPESMKDLRQTMFRLLKAMEASVDLIEAAQDAVWESWTAYHLLEARLKQAAAEEDDDNQPEGAEAMDRNPGIPMSLEDLVRDCWETSRHTLLYAGRMLDFLAFTVPAAAPSVNRAQIALDAVFEELLALPDAIIKGVGDDRIWTRGDLEQALELLVETPEWEHPSLVLSRPRPGDRELLALCEVHLEKAVGPPRKRLVEVRDKLERAVRIADEARERRLKMTSRPKRR